MTMDTTQWHEVWGFKPGHEKALLAKTRSKGLAEIVARELSNYFIDVEINGTTFSAASHLTNTIRATMTLTPRELFKLLSVLQEKRGTELQEWVTRQYEEDKNDWDYERLGNTESDELGHIFY